MKKTKGWLFQNIDKYSKVIEDVEDINYIFNTFAETNNPDLIVSKLYDAVGKKTRQLVRHLWKWAVLELHAINHKKLASVGRAPPEPADEEHDESVGLDDIDDDAERAEEARRLQEVQSEPISANMLHKLLQYEKDVAYANDVRNARPDYKPLVEMSGIFRKRDNRHNRPKSHLELLAEQRDYKRRRMKYRAKNVHITKRTPVQIARDLINLRMEDILIAAGVLTAEGEQVRNRERERENRDRDNNRDNRDNRDRDNRDQRDHRDRDNRGGDNRGDGRGGENRERDNRGDRDNRDNRDNREHRDHRDSRDNRDNRDRGERSGDRGRDDRGERERDRGERDRGDRGGRDRERRERDEHDGDRHRERERDKEPRERERERDSHRDDKRKRHEDDDRDKKDDGGRERERDRGGERDKRSRRERD